MRLCGQPREVHGLGLEFSSGGATLGAITRQQQNDRGENGDAEQKKQTGAKT